MKRISTILIANRGEIASRVIRTCKQLGIRTVAVYSDADANAPFVAQADLALHIGASEPAKSYLDQEKIINAAKRTGADAIHPGYGFLSENSAFAKRCGKEDIIFIGPHPEAIDAMGSKSKAKELMQAHHVPTVPGYQGKDQSLSRLAEEADKIGYPVLFKATAGGGGKGMRIVNTPGELEKSIAAAKREALSAFGNDEMILEKYIESGRHIEFQIFGDQHGHAIHILERECSIQRRYQKVVEESPSPIMSDTLRQAMGSAAVNAAKALKYDNAGTVEFIYDDQSHDFYFLEVNTRLQVEHPVTEEVTGLDLVKMQIESASGMPLSLTQEDIQENGYALEMRLYAENPANDFLPETGTVIQFNIPEVQGLRVESAIESGSLIPIFYDPMIAKLIVHDADRQTAIQKMKYVLENMICLGVQTNQAFLLHLTKQGDFINGNYNTHYIQQNIDLANIGSLNKEEIGFAAIAASLKEWSHRNNQRSLLKSIPSGWRNSFYDYQKDVFHHDDKEIEVQYRCVKNDFLFKIGEVSYNVSIASITENGIRLTIDGLQSDFNIAKTDANIYIHNNRIGSLLLVKKDRLPLPLKEEIVGGYVAPMPSQIIKILVKEGQQIKKGEALMIISSMKMENTIEAIAAGKVASVMTSEGANVEAGYLLMKID